MIQVALPNKGALSDDAVELFRAAGYRCRRRGRELMVRDAHNEVEFIFLRPRDIATYVSNGILEVGVTGRDLMHDSEADVEVLMPLRFGAARFCYAVPKESTMTPDTFTSDTRIATSYTNLVAQDLEQRGIDATVVPLDGAVEISIELGVADAIADVVQTGRTIDEAGLKITGDPILETQAILIAQNGTTADLDAVQLLVERVRGILVAREYVMVEYDLPKDQLENARAITPGIESPTISPLSRDGWLAVKAMAREEHINRIMDDLTALGAKGIIITDIRTCRI
ncbi:MAG: ATP phosphoribosyltransferase [Bacteroidetes bacterium]|jgi:ATP phosphoribosyltransferase|nr:ATP phosphoribosyltransferase [Bacteroidota bacterium]